MMIPLLLACTAPTPEDSGLSWDQPDWDTEGARRWSNTGGWYPNDPVEMHAEIQRLLGAQDGTPKATVSMLAPHARLLSAGDTAAHVYSRVVIPDRVIILVPNHGAGETLAIWDEGPWLVPGTSFQKDTELTDALRAELPELVPDVDAFSRHPPEMQLPFLAELNPNMTFAAVAIRDTPTEHFEQGFTPEEIDRWGTAFAKVMADNPGTLLLASTDLTHWESVDTTATQCQEMLDLIAANDVPGLHSYVTEGEVSIGGEIATAIMMSANAKLGYTQADWQHYGDSFHVNEDPESVIGYPSLGTWSTP